MNVIRLLLIPFALLLFSTSSVAAYSTPRDIQSPFSYNVGIDFATNMTKWYPPGDRQAQIDKSQHMLEGIIKHLKLIRVYSMFVPGWNNDADPATVALANVMNLPGNSNIEAIIGTQNSFDKFCTTVELAENWVSTLKSTFGISVDNVKTILLGNEVNAQSVIDAPLLETCMKNMKVALANAGLNNIPISASFNLLPRDDKPNPVFDPFVSAIVNHWEDAWNNGYPFVMYDPYPDAITTPPGSNDPHLIAAKAPEVIGSWYSDIVNNFASRFNHNANVLQVFIAETGAEGSLTEDGSKLINNAIFTALDAQYKASSNKTVPTILEEAASQYAKPHGQQLMGFFAPDGSPLNGIVIPNWTSQRR